MNFIDRSQGDQSSRGAYVGEGYSGGGGSLSENQSWLHNSSYGQEQSTYRYGRQESDFNRSMHHEDLPYVKNLASTTLTTPKRLMDLTVKMASIVEKAITLDVIQVLGTLKSMKEQKIMVEVLIVAPAVKKGPRPIG